MIKKKRYALVGVGGRASLFYEAIAGQYRGASEVVAFCDPNQTRMDYANRVLKEKYRLPAVPSYGFEAFDQMVKKEKPDSVIVTSIDRTHHSYIIRSLELGCEVITEKPMTIDEEKCQAILDCVKRTKRKVRVCFNYRYAPHNTKAKELLMKKVIGEIFSIHFEWLLDIRHGADYFRRWHRDKRNSGGLLVHKATHHFDLVNFWLGTRPQIVYALGDLRFYGRANAESRGISQFYARAHGSSYAQNDYFALHLEENPVLKAMYLDAEWEDGYYRDQSVFGDGISIEDTMGVMVRYHNKAILTYSLNAYMPWEGFRVGFNGSGGRLELAVGENTCIDTAGKREQEGSVKSERITVYPMFGDAYPVEVEESEGGHGGADPFLLEDLFGPPKEDPYHRSADHIDGAVSILTGIAANKSMMTGLPVKIDELVSF
ncbi:MAG: Gfo/Idh/MocA family oxidoreductase [Spirochaetota bacterium]